MVSLQSMTRFNDDVSSRPVIDVPVDAGGDGVVVPESAKTLRIGTRSDLLIVGLSGDFIAFWLRW